MGSKNVGGGDLAGKRAFGERFCAYVAHLHLSASLKTSVLNVLRFHSDRLANERSLPVGPREKHLSDEQLAGIMAFNQE